jgi:predicted metal-dependent hydrolase
LLGLLLVVAGTVTAARHAEMKAAREALREAESILKAAPEDYSGHRRLALSYVQLAIDEIDRGVTREERRARDRDAKGARTP